MKTLIVHPNDNSTNFLCPIYERIENKTVIRGGVTKKALLKIANKHDRIMMMGHGSKLGLLAVSQFYGEGHEDYIIDKNFVSSLSNKDNVFIWCHADMFVNQHQLNGFYSGMFISEVLEAYMYDYEVSQKTIDKSNNVFSKIVSNYINQSSSIIYENVKKEYGSLAKTNPIAKYNHERLFLA